MKWQLLSEKKIITPEDIIKVLLENRKIKDEADFFNPKDPSNISIKDLGINEKEVIAAVKRIKEALRKKEKIIVYGDYDADGICATAIMWETLHALSLNVLPYIPERFSEGYGLNIESIRKLKEEDPDLKLIITVDHGIVAEEKVDVAKEIGIDVIISDHHQKEKTLPKALSIIHTDKISGSGVAWILSREILKSFKSKEYDIAQALELAAIGTVADQLPLTDANRSIVKYGIEKLNETKRPGLRELFRQSGIGEVGTYEIGYVIAPRINAMGRLSHAIDSLRIVCTGSNKKALELAGVLNETNMERQRIVEEVVRDAGVRVKNEKIIVLAHEKYHEGVIGLAAGRLAEEFYRPAIVFSRGKEISKASARSISGFNIIETIRKLSSLYIEGGGHPMAAGFSIETKMIEEFKEKITEISEKELTDEILEKKLRVDTKIEFKDISWNLVKRIKEFDPVGLGNPSPVFESDGVEILETRLLGAEGKHLKLKLKQDEQVFDAIFFGGGKIYSKIESGSRIDIAYNLEENIWNGRRSLQLKVKDIKIS